jgi:hypothetical protein
LADTLISKLRKAASSGDTLDLRTGDKRLDDPGHIGLWPPERTIAAPDLVALLTEPPSGSRRLRSLSLRGARIDGELDFDGLQLLCPLTLIDCYLEDLISLQEAELHSLRLIGCLLASGLNAHGAIIRSSLELCTGLESLASIRLNRAQIGGYLNCDGARLFAPGDIALGADHISVGNSVRLDGSFVAQGEVRFDGASIEGQLICQGGTLSNRDGMALSAYNASIKHGVLFSDEFTVHGETRFNGAQIEGPFVWEIGELSNPDGNALTVDGASIRGDLQIGPHCLVKGSVRMVDVTVLGTVVARNTLFHNPGGIALAADRASVRGGMFLDSNFYAMGEVRIPSAKIGGLLSCAGAQIINPDGDALVLDNANITGDVFLSESFVARGTVRLLDATVGSMYCHGAAIIAFARPAVYASYLSVRGNVYFDGGFEARGEVQMSGAKIGSRLICTGARLNNPDGMALHCDGLSAGDVYLSHDFRARGAVRFQGANIRGHFSCRDGHFSSPDGVALLLDGSSIHGIVSLCGDFTAKGEVRMIAASITGQVNCDGGQFINPHGDALAIDSTDISDSLSCMGEFQCVGALRLMQTKIDGQAILTGTLAGTNSTYGALLMGGATVGRELFLTPAEAVRGRISLVNCAVGHLRDGDAAWTGEYELRGFAYGTLAGSRDKLPRSRWWGSDPAARARVDWLDSNKPGYEPQIYEQLAQSYARAGHAYRQKLVLIAGLRRRRKNLGPPAKLWSVVEDLLFGFGHRPWRILIPFLALFVFGVFFFGSHTSEITPVDPTINYPAFRPLPYTLDLLVPVINLGQRDSWVASGGVQEVTTVFVVAGWVLSAAVLTLLSSLLRRRS